MEVDTLLENRYLIGERVGVGGMSEVFRGEDTKLHMPVAIKVIKAQARLVDRTRFKREINILQGLHHPGIVRYVDHGTTEDGRLFLVMEWLAGRDLSSRLAQGQVGLSTAVKIVLRASEALSPVHRKGLVHRDLKPSNIFLVSRQQGFFSVKLIDFGLVKIPNPDDWQTQQGSFIGTPWFIAPEQARGDVVDSRADVYSLGAILFRLVVGRSAFETTHLLAYLGRLVLEDAPRARSLRRDIPPELDDIIASTLQRDARSRPVDAAHLAELLRTVPKLVNDKPVLSKSVPPPPLEQTLSDMVQQRLVSDADVSASRPSITGEDTRVVAVLLAQLPAKTLDGLHSQALIRLLGESARFEPLRDGRLIAALGMTRTDGSEAIRAARAALMLRRVAPGALVAVAAGRVFTGSRGISGEALERAAELLGSLKEPGIKIDEVVEPLLDGRFLVETSSEGICLLHEDNMTSEPRRFRGKAMPFLARDRELAELMNVFFRTIQHKVPHGCAVLGTPGVGKTRLRQELVKRLRAAPYHADVLLARGEPTLASDEISDIGRALRDRMGILNGEADEVMRLKLVRYVTKRPGIPPQSADFLGTFVGLTPAEDTQPVKSAQGTPTLMSARMFFAAENLLRMDAKERPQVLVIENADDLDQTSSYFLDWLLDSHKLPITVYIFGRPSAERRLAQTLTHRVMTRQVLGPLPLEASESIATQMAPELDEQTRSAITRKAQGNPLFLEELLRHSLRGQKDLPASIQTLLQERLDALPEREHEALRAAAVFGPYFWTDAVTALVDRDVTEDLAQLEAKDIIVKMPARHVDESQRWSFEHGLLREAAYRSLRSEQQRELHARAAEWLLLSNNGDLGRIAMHAEFGGDRRMAARYYGKAAAAAYRAGRVEEALGFATSGVACGDEPLRRAQTLLQRAQVLSWMGKFKEQREAAESAVSLTQVGSDIWAEARRLLAEAYRQEGDPEQAELLLDSTLQDATTETMSLPVQSRLLSARSRALVDLGRADEALGDANHAVQAAQLAESHGTNPMLRALDARSQALSHMGDFAASVQTARELVQRADSLEELMFSTKARIHLGFSLTRIGIFDEGMDVLHRARQAARELRMKAGEGFAIHCQGRVLVRQHAFDEAIQHAQLSLSMGLETGHHRLIALSRIYLAMYLAWRKQQGDLDKAQALISELSTYAGTHPVGQTGLGLARSQVEWALGDKKRALKTCTDALQTAHLMSALEEGEEGLLLTRARLLIELGMDEQADLAIRDAYDCVRDRCRRITDPTYREAFLNNVYENRKIFDLAGSRLSLTRPLTRSVPPTKPQ